MKKTITDLIKKIKNIWEKDCVNILVPAISVLIFIVAIFVIEFVKAIIILILINLIYFGINYLLKKDIKNKLKKKENTVNMKKKEEAKKINLKKKIKNKKNNTNKKKKWKKRLKIVLLIFLSLFILGIIAMILFFNYIVSNAPEFNEELLYVTDPTVILDKNGNEIAKLGTEQRVTLDYDEIPEVLIDAIVATEDSRFFEHNGVDWARFLKASFYQLLGKSEAGGASTLTMQVSKNTHTSTEASGIDGIIRKFTDVYMSIFKIEKNYTKEQIMAFYVNSPYLGRNAYGVEQVSLTYFGKSTKELNLAEAALVAGLFQAPGRYDPYKNPEATENRRQTVLKLMLRHGYISKKEYNIAKELTVEKIVLPLDQNPNANGSVLKYQSFVDTIVEEVKKKTGQNPYTTPMIIYSTLDTDFQDYINGIMNGETYNWENEIAQAGVAVVSVKDGSIAAIGGGRNVSAIDEYNYATDLNNQIGSTAKPLYDYGPAVEYMNWSSAQILPDEPISYSDGTKINNWDGKFEGLETIRVALKGSRNIPALKAFKKNNKANIIEFVTNLGLTPEIYSCNEGYKLDGKYCISKTNPDDIIEAKQSTTLHEAHAIGGYNGESPLTMAAAYAAFANNGTYTEPYSFTKLIYQENGEEFINEIKQNKAMSQETAYILSDMLATTATQAMGRYYNINGIKYAAKTGTTNYDEKAMIAHKMPSKAVNDLWTVGYNTEYAIGVWYGYDKINNQYYNTITNQQHNRLFNAVGKKVFTNNAYFTKPNGVVAVEVEIECPEPTLPSPYTPSHLRQTELFIQGTQPTSVSTRFSQLKDVTNLKATNKNGKVTLTWDKIEKPDFTSEEFLRKHYSSIFETQEYLNSFINTMMGYNSSYIGNVGYNIYILDDNKNLKLLDYVSTNKFETTLDVSGEYTFVVKTAYSIFKDNMSKGKEVKVKLEIDSPIIPDTDDSNSEENNNDNSNNN